ncbi:aminodeoxychorismate lyase [Pseudalkalibacillus caeni]|uniref:Aminodeoxychorismate lyase n=1 Tax=Exobacillus caeni TaxID=2574798 RepID=A0A5R9F3I4_9BACL|nr:aminodeoxychorismate lyase [Pseudalkalibacillus caeni]TLS34994.1 aminodeoxychorismate lyase [Pseudalkalibacillus caeni]
MYICINGRVLKEEEAKISPFDHGFMYGLGVFETFRVYNGHPFLFDDHFDRLQSSLAALNIKLNVNKASVLHDINELLKVNQLKDAYVRLNVSAGDNAVGLTVEKYENPNVIIYMKPIGQPAQVEKNAVILQIRRNTPEGPLRLKSHHYLNNILAKREVGPDPSVEGIFLTDQGHVAEGIVSNVFWVKDGKVFTPSLSTGILNGITRQFIIELLAFLNIKVEVGHFTKEHLLDCDEAFVTNSIQEVVPVKKLEGKSLPGAAGEITDKLHSYYVIQRNRLWSRKNIQVSEVEVDK